MSFNTTLSRFILAKRSLKCINLLAAWYSILQTHYNSIFSSPIHGYFCYFKLIAIVNSTDVNTLEYISWGTCERTSLCICLRMGLLNHRVCKSQIYVITPKWHFFYNPTNKIGEFLLIHIPSDTQYCQVS